MLNYSQTRLMVSNMAECVRFYRDTLGLTLGFGGEDDIYSDFSLGNGVSLALFDSKLMAEAINAPYTPASGDGVALNFMVGNLDAAMQTLSAKGVRFLTPAVARADWGMRTAHFRDPAGNLLEIAEEYREPA
jgi:catechol 2,3-dioxygenase-like lactoylglutathione lyase family enzyme